MTPEEQRDWDEYLAWTRNASPGEYGLTEELAWRRLQLARVRRRLAPYGYNLTREALERLREVATPREQPLQGRELDSSRPVGGSEA